MTAPPPAADQPPPPPTDQPPYLPVPPYPPAAEPHRAGSDSFFDAVRRVGVVRTQDRWVGGVAGGVALRFGIDPLLVRGIIGITVLFGGAGLILYGLAWALLPEQADGRIHLQETIRGRFDAALLGAIGAVIVGLSRGDGWFGWWNGSGYGWLTGILWFAAVATLVGLVIAAANQRGNRRPPAGPVDQFGPFGPSASGAPTPAPEPAPAPAPGAAPARPTAYPAPAGGYAGYSSPGGYAGRPARGYAGPPTTDAPAWPPSPPKPLKPRVHGPGSAAVGAVVGLTLVALAALLIADRQGTLDVPVGLCAAGIGIVLAGLAIMVAGIRGRRSGALGFLAIVAIVLAVPAAVIGQTDWTTRDGNVQFLASGGDWTPTTVAQARNGLAVAVGDVNVDLRQLATGGEVVRVPISVGAGQLTVTVPPGTAITADVRLAAGDISWEVDSPQRISGVTGSRTYDFASKEVADGVSPTLVLRLESGAGQVRVVEADR